MHAQWRTVEHEIDQITAASSKYDGALHILLYGAHYMELLSLYVLAEYRITLGLLLLLWRGLGGVSDDDAGIDDGVIAGRFGRRSLL